jgi:ElaB/YqjD/DUF883 family membrane-anchored ribosome-binding protein
MPAAHKKLRAVDYAGDAADSVAARFAETSKAVREDVGAAAQSVADQAAALAGKLKAAGIDTDMMVDTAREKGGELQSFLVGEMRARPLRTLGVAAAIGVIVGLMTAR